MATDQMAATVVVDQQGDPVVTRGALELQIAGWIEALPEAGEGDDTAILAQLAAAETFEDINRPWQAVRLEQWIGREIVITGVRRLASDFESGFGWYLACDAIDAETGEANTIIAGANAVVAQLAAVAHLGGFPVRCTPAAARRAKPGRTPAQHLANVRPA